MKRPVLFWELEIVRILNRIWQVHKVFQCSRLVKKDLYGPSQEKIKPLLWPVKKYSWEETEKQYSTQLCREWKYYCDLTALKSK